MAGLALVYQGNNRATFWDIRWRLVSLTVYAVAVLSVESLRLVPLTLVVVVLLPWAGQKWRDIGVLLRGLLALFGFFLGVGLLLTPTWAHAQLLLVQSVRLLLLFLASHFLMVTATPDTVVRGLQWFLSPLGARRAYLGASMASWALASVPKILAHAQGLREAAVLRGLTGKQPLVWMRLLSIGLLIRVIETSAVVAEALEMRGFGSQTPPHGLLASTKDAVLGLMLLGWCALWMILP